MFYILEFNRALIMHFIADIPPLARTEEYLFFSAGPPNPYSKFCERQNEQLRRGKHKTRRKIFIAPHVHDAGKPVNPGMAVHINRAGHPVLIHAGIDAG